MANKVLWPSEYAEKTPSDYLKAVFETADWISDYEHKTDSGSYWDILPGKEVDEDATLTSIGSLYGGAAGVALFFLRLYQVTCKEEYLDKARSGIDFAIGRDKGKAEYEKIGEGTLKGIPIGLMNGPIGAAYVAYLVYEITKNEKYLIYTKQATEVLLEEEKDDEKGGYWSDVCGILSDGGLILYLIWLYEKLKDKRYLAAADKAGKRIVENADETEDTARWLAMDSVAFGLGKNGYFPGFFYGTAGTGYILTKLYEHTKNERYLELAIKASNYIKRLADKSPNGKAALIQYNDPYVPDMHYLGVCQGPIGHSRLFYKLYKITGEEEYKEWIIKLTDGILATGAPKIHSKGYWHTYCYCCGAAGMVEHFLEIYELTKNEKYKTAAREGVEVLLGDSNLDEGKRRWYTAWNRHLPNEVEAWTGLYHGSAGCASSILFYYNYLTDKKKISGYIEDPYQELF
ncbi:MAG: hypothetical protein IJV15_13210 [Lachnospiraceae bacterium]|nr:hypothetical protein [Lachnospiraceae bacterium]